MKGTLWTNAISLLFCPLTSHFNPAEYPQPKGPQEYFATGPSIPTHFTYPEIR